MPEKLSHKSRCQHDYNSYNVEKFRITVFNGPFHKVTSLTSVMSSARYYILRSSYSSVKTCETKRNRRFEMKCPQLMILRINITQQQRFHTLCKSSNEIDPTQPMTALAGPQTRIYCGSNTSHVTQHLKIKFVKFYQ